MHFEILIEDKSGKKMLDILIPQIISDGNSFKIYNYQGIGRLPPKTKINKDIKKLALLNDLPRILSGYGKTFKGYGNNYKACVVIICDLDDRNLGSFKTELINLLNDCHVAPKTEFCIAIEEGEAWLLGDLEAILKAYPDANKTILKNYINDSICGTWEVLKQAIDEKQSKLDWAEKIAPYMKIEANESPSFQYFIKSIKNLCDS